MSGKKYTEVELEDKLKNFIKSVTNTINIDQIILFGSYAKGNPHEYSDIDIALVSEDLDPKLARWQNIELIMERSKMKYDPELQLVPFAKEAFENDAESPIGSFIREIKETGKIIYPNGNTGVDPGNTDLTIRDTVNKVRTAIQEHEGYINIPKLPPPPE